MKPVILWSGNEHKSENDLKRKKAAATGCLSYLDLGKSGCDKPYWFIDHSGL